MAYLKFLRSLQFGWLVWSDAVRHREISISRWHGICATVAMKKVKPLEIAPWAKAELRAQRRAARREGIRSHARWTFIVLFFATALVFVFNHQIGALQIASRQIHRVVDKATLSDHLRDNALKYEKSIDVINEPNSQPTAPTDSQSQNP